ncbi:AAA family ATPase [Sphingomonas sanguinis]|uniref:AAA family ATPase n=1 Tax=Sphingomonas sanguinis TaxID=33051 RepID=UPI0019D31F9D|nr:AAA family ATPase [Sphingomonas sanguinis]MBZ6383995.1 AAA family ATPase [Sphingomonas sanguinis]
MILISFWGASVIVTIGNTKGGVGKTTLAVQIAIARAMAGRDVWLIDGDRQGTAAAAIDIRAQAGRLPGIACAKYDEGPALRAQIQQQRDKWQDIIIDAGGRDSTALRAALVLSDVLLVPFAPRSYDVWALDDMAKLIDDARSTRDGLRCFAIMNLADPGEKSTDNAEAADAVKEFPQFEYLPFPIRRRKAFSNAGGSGLAISEMPAKDTKAAAELDTLIASLFNIPSRS